MREQLIRMTPVRFVVTLLTIVFLTEAGIMLVLPVMLSTHASRAFGAGVDALLLVVILAPTLWWVIMRPLQRRATSDEQHATRLSAILEATPDLVSIADLEGRLVYLNRAGRTMLGIDELADLTNVNLQQFHDAANARVVMTEAIPTAVRDGAWTGETVLTSLDGRAIPISQVILAHKTADGTLAFLSTVARDITERNLARDALRMSEQFLAQSQGLAHLGSWNLDLETNTLTWSDELYRIYGVSPEVFVPTVDAFLPLIHVDDRSAMRSWIDAVLSGKTPGPLDFGVVRPDGTIRVIEGDGEVQVDADNKPIRLIGTAQDITERKAADRRLLDSEGKFRTLFETAQDGVFLMNAHGFLDCNAYAEGLFGCRKADLIGHSPVEFSPFAQPDGRLSSESAAEHVHAAMAGSPQRFAWQHARADGTTFDTEVTLNRIDVSGETLLQAIVRDVSEHTRLEVSLRAARDVADAASRAKSEFLANMSHEIRTPMNGVIGMTELLSDTVLEPVQREYVDIIKISADALLSVIEEILDFSKIEAGMLQIDPTTVEVGQVFGDAVKALALQAHQKGLELVYHVAPAVPEYIVADPLRLRQVVTNLLSNAIKFTERGEVAMDVDAEPCDGGDLTLHVRVKDTGVGIARDIQERIFLPFEQADGSTTRRHGGTGLGLTITNRLAKLMQGRLWVESEEGRGSTFHFTARVTPGIGVPSHTVEDAALDGLRVLIIDDNATNRFVLREMVHHWGMRPTTADGGERGLDALRESILQNDPYQVVLLDSHMPGIDGFMVAERMRENPGLRDVTVLMLTSAERSSDVRRCRELGLAAYFVKPVTQKELRTTVVRVLSGTAALVHSERGAIAASDRSLRILLAEDNVVNQKVAVALLSQFHHEVTVTPDGQAAVDAYRRQPFDLILMDVQMPVLDGFAATRAIRQIERATGTHTPIVAMTARAMKGDRERCLDAGMDDYLSKPIQGARVTEVIRRVLGPSPVPPDAPKRAEEDDPVASAPAGALDPAVLTRLRMLAQATAPALFAEVLTLFQTDAAAYVVALQDAAAADDRVRLARTAHALKGASLTVGATTMADACRQLETVEGTGSLVAVPSLLAQLESEFKRVTAEIERELDQEQVNENTHR